MTSSRSRALLTKSLFTAGTQCPKLMWLRKHEPAAPELTVDADLQSRFDLGHRVGELARTYVPGGVLIDRQAADFQRSIDQTQSALYDQSKAIYEAVLKVGDLYCAIDILERTGSGWNLIEVKSSMSVKDAHFPDVAIQTYIARQAGLKVDRVEVMVLSRECVFPDLTKLFARVDVTDRVNLMLATIGDDAVRLLSILNTPIVPDVSPGDQCSAPYKCPFYDRCNPALPKHHVSSLYKVHPKVLDQLLSSGVQLIADIPDDVKLRPDQARQRAAVKSGHIVVEGPLKRELDKLKSPVGFLDFETAMPAIPVLEGCGPYSQCVAQFSFHLEDGKGGHSHHEWIATGKGDPRRPLAEALVKACKGAKTILSYFAPFESKVIAKLAKQFPDLRDDLNAINERIVDLLPLVRNHVYHPEFYGSFSIKKVLPALCPELSYEGMAVGEGQTAARLLEVIMTAPDLMKDEERAAVVRDLKAYCKLDTWAMVALLKRLKDLSVRP